MSLKAGLLTLCALALGVTPTLAIYSRNSDVLQVDAKNFDAVVMQSSHAVVSTVAAYTWIDTNTS